MTWDGNNLWLSIFGYGGRVVKLDNSLSVIEEGYGYVIEGISWTSDTLLIASSWSGRVFQGFTGNRTEIYDFGWQQNIYGMDWDGQFLWVAIDNELFKCSYDDSSQVDYIDITPLEKYNFPCLGCPFAIFEMKNLTIGEICKMYKINLKNLLNDLNEVLKDK